MSGHSCSPGLRHHWSDGDPQWGQPAGWYLDPPSQYTHPAGTVWQCECGKTWVAKPPRYVNWPGDVTWRRERWWERRWRLRAGIQAETDTWEADKRDHAIAKLEGELGIGKEAP